MKSSIRKKTYRAIYRLLDRVSPLSEDCGALCGAACCTVSGDEDDASDFPFGMYLLPGEEKVFTRKESWLRWSAENVLDYDFPDSWSGKVWFVRCNSAPHCPREMRPLQCRFFPLTPHLDENGVLHLILFPGELPYSCPLIAEKIKLDEKFVRATYTVWKRLICDPLIYDLVEMDSENRSGDFVEFVYPPSTHTFSKKKGILHQQNPHTPSTT